MNLNATIIGQSITFFFFVWFCMKFIWPLVGAAMRERQETIAAGLRASEEADQKLALAASNAEEELTTAKAEASAIIEQARARARGTHCERRAGPSARYAGRTRALTRLSGEVGSRRTGLLCAQRAPRIRDASGSRMRRKYLPSHHSNR